MEINFSGKSTRVEGNCRSTSIITQLSLSRAVSKVSSLTTSQSTPFSHRYCTTTKQLTTLLKAYREKHIVQTKDNAGRPNA